MTASLNKTREKLVCTNTVRGRLRSAGLMGRVAKKKNTKVKANWKKRLQWT